MAAAVSTVFSTPGCRDPANLSTPYHRVSHRADRWPDKSLDECRGSRADCDRFFLSGQRGKQRATVAL
jgi:hypothetical protein